MGCPVSDDGNWWERGNEGLRGATVSLLMEWSLLQLSQASEPQLRAGQDDVYNVSNCWSWFPNPPSMQTFGDRD